MESELLELKIVAIEVKRSQIVFDGQFVSSPSDGRGLTMETDMDSTGRSRSWRNREA